VLRALNQRTRTAARSNRLLLCGVGQLLNVNFLGDIFKMNPRLLSLSLFTKFKSLLRSPNKLIIVILKERKGLRARVLVQNFLHALKSLSVAMLRCW